MLSKTALQRSYDLVSLGSWNAYATWINSFDYLWIECFELEKGCDLPKLTVTTVLAKNGSLIFGGLVIVSSWK